MFSHKKTKFIEKNQVLGITVSVLGTAWLGDYCRPRGEAVKKQRKKTFFQGKGQNDCVRIFAGV